MSSVDEILARAKSLIQDFKKGDKTEVTPNKYEPNPLEKFIYKKYLQVLAPEGFEWSDIIVNIYIDEDWENRTIAGMGVVGKNTAVIHGHSRGVGCSLPAQCHVREYRPTGEEPRPFLENWKRFGYD